MFKEAFRRRLDQPKLPGSALKGKLAGYHKIKLAKQGYRRIYEVLETEVIVLVLSVNKREDALACLLAEKRR